MSKIIKRRVLYTIKEHHRQVVRICSAATILGLFVVFSLMGKMGEIRAAGVQSKIADEIIRFHVIANSDSDEDQELKIVVKEKVVKDLHNLLKDANTVLETQGVIRENLDRIKEVAHQTVVEQGYEYEVTAELLKCYFPMKSYGDLTFPAGEYEALRVCIGKSGGRNWWCVIFPNLCFIDSIHAVVPEEQKEELKNVLTEEEYDSLFSWKGSKVHIKMKLLEFFKK